MVSSFCSIRPNCSIMKLSIVVLVLGTAAFLFVADGGSPTVGRRTLRCDFGLGLGSFPEFEWCLFLFFSLFEFKMLAEKRLMQ
jgi:hypothetical protein